MKYLNQPHPLDSSWRSTLRTAIAFALFVAVFLFIFEPFGTGGMDWKWRTLNALIFGLVTASGILICASIGRFWPDWFGEERWILGKEGRRRFTDKEKAPRD